MSKYLDKVIKEMAEYGNMGMPDGETTMGMGDVNTIGVRGSSNGKSKITAYKMNDILRSRNRAEEEEYSMDDSGMGDEMDSEGMEGGDTEVEEMKSFFKENPTPSDDEVAQYASDKGIELEELRQVIYRMIQDLMGDDESVDDEFSFGDESEMGDDMNSETGDEMGSMSQPRM